jgi:hypothetical protein
LLRGFFDVDTPAAAAAAAPVKSLDAYTICGGRRGTVSRCFGVNITRRSVTVSYSKAAITELWCTC